MSSDLQTQLSEAEKSFKRACEQIIHLNRRLDEMAKRYDKASRENHRSFRYSLRLRMAVSEGVRNMYYEYAANKADLISELRYKVADTMGLRTMADNMGLRTVGNVNPALADRVESERREWESTRGSADGTAAGRTTDGGVVDTQVTNSKTSTQGSAGNSATQDAENVEEDPAVPSVEGIPVAQYDSSDMDSPSAGSSGLSVVNEASDDSELMESYFTSDGAENSNPARTSDSPVSYVTSA